MATTQNGWSIITASNLDRSNIPGTSVVPAPGVRSGDVAVILHYIGSQFDKRVQKLVSGWAWGWAPPQMLGNGTYSNHGSGTAIDLNAPNFPMGKRNMTAKQISACRGIVKELDGAVRWGGEWAGANVDQMHFEIVGNASKVKSVANKLKGGNMVNKSQVDHAVRFYLGRNSNSQDLSHVGKSTWGQLVSALKGSNAFKTRINNAKSSKLKPINHLPTDLRSAYVAPPPKEVIREVVITKEVPIEVEKIVEVEVEVPVEVIKEVPIGDKDRSFGDLLGAAFRKLFNLK